VNHVVKVPFRQDTLYAVQDGEVTRVAIKKISDSFGLNWAGQLQRIKRDPILKAGMCIMHMPSLRGGMQQTVTLPLTIVAPCIACRQRHRIR
jgi:hypothetical protein